MSDLSILGQYYKLADQLIERSSKEEIAECAKLLALNVAHYQSKYGELPLDEMLGMMACPSLMKHRFSCSKLALRFSLGCWAML